MKESFNAQASRWVNMAVLRYYGIELNKRKDLAELDRAAIHGISQAMTFVVKRRYPESEEWVVDLLVSCVMREIMHVDPQITKEETKEHEQIMVWSSVVTALRESLTKKYAGTILPNDELVSIIVEEMLMRIERLLFGRSSVEIQ